MTKTKLQHFARAIEKAEAAFRAEITKLAAQARAEILPYFRAHNLDYQAGNGTWFITRPGVTSHDRFVDDDELPPNIRDLLWLEVARADHLGFYIADIKRRT